LCLGLAIALAAGVTGAATDPIGKCQGTKQQRKQKIPPRDLTKDRLEALINEYERVVAGEVEEMKSTALRRLDRVYEQSEASGTPFVVDVLVISGGGAKGAFGAGFLEGWGTIDEGPFQRPEFDVVTGVSTGALIAPFAFIGTDKAFATAAGFYANPEPNWVKKRGLIDIWPHHISLFNNCHLQDAIRNGLDPALVAAIADAAAQDRLLLIGTTNLDVGAGRIFDLTRAAREAHASGSYDRVHEILLASSAIPGVFPPIEMDGMLYADGGATSNLFILAFPGLFDSFLSEHPGANLPTIRVWVLVNQQLKPQHEVTEPRWISISDRALKTLTATDQLFALKILQDRARQVHEQWGIEVELHLVSIPQDAPATKTRDMFDPTYMRALEDLGRKMGADPSSWVDSIPSAYRVNSQWQ